MATNREVIYKMLPEQLIAAREGDEAAGVKRVAPSFLKTRASATTTNVRPWARTC